MDNPFKEDSINMEQKKLDQDRPGYQVNIPADFMRQRVISRQGFQAKLSEEFKRKSELGSNDTTIHQTVYYGDVIDSVDNNDEEIIEQPIEYSHNFKFNCYVAFQVLRHLFIMVFQTLWSFIIHICLVIADICKLIFYIVIGLILVLFFMIKSILPSCHSNPLEQGHHKDQINVHLQERKKKQFTLCLELDNLLLWQTNKQPKRGQYKKIRLRPLDEKTQVVYLVLRPYVKEFLIKLHKKFNIIVYTKRNRNFADDVLAIIDDEFVVEYSVFRESFENQEKFQKTIQIFPEGVQDKILFIDVNEDEIVEKKQSFIIKPFQGNPKDDILKRLADILILNTPSKITQDFDLSKLKMFENKLNQLIMDLKYFILSSNSRILYRKFLKSISKVSNLQIKTELHTQIRYEFNQNRNLNDHKQIKYMQNEGLRRLKELQEMLTFTMQLISKNQNF